MNRRTLIRPTALLLTVLLVIPVTGSLDLDAEPTGKMDAGLLKAVTDAPGAAIDAFLTLEGDLTHDRLTAIEDIGLTVLRPFQQIGVVYVSGLGHDLLEVKDLPGVLWVSPNKQLEHFMATEAVSTRAREVWDSKSTSATPVTVGGTVVDGSGVSIAVVDSGIDATHPDLAPAVARNLKYACSTPGLISTASNTCYGNWVAFGDDGCNDGFPGWVASPNTDSSSGHGTHVAGIAAGRGIASDGRFQGAAPGATLYGLGTGETIVVLHALEAFNWVLCNHATYNIRIVTNSWGDAPGPHNPLDPINVAANAMVAQGITVLFAAGNDGPATNTLSSYSRNPTLGVISVASYNDNDQADRPPFGGISGFSSRCAAAQPFTECPDVAAPGDWVVSTVPKNGVVALPTELNYMPYYGAIGGTSMATPHVAGIAALLLQANPALTPAQVECVLERNAVPMGGAIPDNSCGGKKVNIHHAAGHGLVDAIASLQDPLVLGAAAVGSPLPQVSQNPHLYLGGVDGQLVAGVQWTVPAATPVTLSERFLSSSTLPLTGQPCRFQVFTAAGPAPYAPGALVATVPCTGGVVDAEPSLSAGYSFPSTLGTATYLVEPQVNFGGGMTALNSFAVHVVV